MLPDVRYVRISMKLACTPVTAELGGVNRTLKVCCISLKLQLQTSFVEFDC